MKINTQNILKIRFLILFVIVFAFSKSCIEKEDYDPNLISGSFNMSPGIALPLARSNLHISDFIREKEDTVIFDREKDSLVTIVFRDDSVYSAGIDDFFDDPFEEAFEEVFDIKDVKIEHETIRSTVSFGSILDQMDKETSAYNVLKTIAEREIPLIVPETTPVSAGSHRYTSPEDYEYITVSEGIVIITILNNLAIPVKFTLGLRDEIYNESFGTLEFPVIDPGETASREMDLAGKTMSSQLLAQIVGFSTPGSDGQRVRLNRSDNVDFIASLRNMKISSGKAVIPEQTISDSLEVDFTDQEEKIKNMRIRSGRLSIHVQPIIEADFDLILFLPTITRNNSTLDSIRVHISKDENIDFNIDLTNTETDLSSMSPPYNKIPFFYKVHIPGGQKVEFQVADNILITEKFTNMDFDYLQGYFGQKEINIEEQEIDLGISLFDNIEGGFLLTNPSLKVHILNSVGIPVDIESRIVATSATEKQENLGYTFPEINSPDTPGELATTSLVINNENSDIVDFFATPPYSITFGAEYYTNPDGETFTNFITSDSYINIGVEMDVPFEIQTSTIGISDTISYDSEKISDITDYAEEATIIIEYVNEFPLNIQTDFLLYNSETNTVLDSLIPVQPYFIQASEIDVFGVTSQPTSGTAFFSLSNSEINSLANGDAFIIRGNISTAEEEAVKIHANYKLDLFFKLTAGLVYNSSEN
jgi:hypothetical protein